MQTIKISSINYTGKLAHILFFPDSLGEPIDLGYQIIPYLWTTDDWYGTVHLHFEEYDSTCVIESLRPTPTPTPTLTPTKNLTPEDNCNLNQWPNNNNLYSRATITGQTSGIIIQGVSNDWGWHGSLDIVNREDLLIDPYFALYNSIDSLISNLGFIVGESVVISNAEKDLGPTHPVWEVMDPRVYNGTYKIKSITDGFHYLECLDTITPTPTPTQTPMGASITIVNQPQNSSIDEYRGFFTVRFTTTSPSTTTVTTQKQTDGLGEFVDQYTTIASNLFQNGSIFEARQSTSFGKSNADYFDSVTRDKYRFVITSGANSVVSDIVQFTFSGSNRGPHCANIGILSRSNKITTVGTNGGSSYYGTYDQGGLVYEWNDALEMFNRQYQRGIRSGHWAGGNVSMGHTNARFFNNPGINLNEDGTVNSYPIKSDVIGFRLSSSTDPLDYHSFTSGSNEFLTVGDLGNPPYLNYTANNVGGQAQYGYAYKLIGQVDYEYKIMKYPVTNAEYVLFLNAADHEGNRYDFYDSKMSSDITGGILFNNSASIGSKYSVKTNMGNKPVVFIDWFSAVKFANWLHNMAVLGQTPIGLEYTLDGAYTLNGYQPNIQANQNALYRVPTEDEWLKAGYYKGPDPLNSRNEDYWDYPTRHPDGIYHVTFDSFGNGIIPQNAYY
jgi:formylglycine-generating enzyme required for sulfatase activity